jgi:hypothetical protein
MSVRDVARVAARKFEDRLRDEVDIPPISLDAPPASTKDTAANAAPSGAPAPSGAASTNAPTNAPANGLAAGSPSTEAHPAPVTGPKMGVDPASQFARSSNGAHSAERYGKPDADRGATYGTPSSAPDADAIERAQQGGIQPRPLPPGSVPRE